MSRLRQAASELWTLVALWQGLGAGDDADPAVRRGAGFLAAQTAVAIVLTAAVSLVKAAIAHDGDLSQGWRFGLFVPLLPLVAGVARIPPGLAIALAVAVPAGLLTGVLVGWALGAVATGYWVWFAAVAAGSLVAGPAFGALARERAQLP